MTRGSWRRLGASRAYMSQTTRRSEGGALFQFFNLSLTKNEDQNQFLLQVVKKHRRQQLGTSKASLPRPSGRQ